MQRQKNQPPPSVSTHNSADSHGLMDTLTTFKNMRENTKTRQNKYRFPVKPRGLGCLALLLFSSSASPSHKLHCLFGDADVWPKMLEQNTLEMMLKRRRACGRIAVTEQLQRTCEILEERRGERQPDWSGGGCLEAD